MRRIESLEVYPRECGFRMPIDVVSFLMMICFVDTYFVCPKGLFSTAYTRYRTIPQFLSCIVWGTEEGHLVAFGGLILFYIQS
jgi:hypothetical protein